jgi:tetratricopeptide (TPR) repeat protein
MPKNLFSSFLPNYLKIFLLFSFLLIESVSANQLDELMKQGGDYYRNSEYDKAIETYEGLINSGFEGTTLYYNLANSYYRIGKLGYAILNYERALKFSPSDEDVKHNLEFANLSTVDRIQPLPKFFIFDIWEAMLGLLSVNGWSYLVYIFYLILLLLTTYYFFVKTIFQQKFILFSGLVVLIIIALLVSLLVVKLNRETTEKSGVIVVQSVTVKTSPDVNSTDTFIIHEGLKVRLEDKLDDWIKIRLADGKIGWILNEKAEEI